MKHPDYDIPSLLDMLNKFVALQTVATLSLAVAAEQFATHDYWVAIGAGLLGVVAYVIYEVLPQK